MPLLVRKINKSKWLQNNILEGEDVSADAITNCMKTSKNTLSTWRVNSVEEIDRAVLAIVSAHEHLDTIDVVWFEQEKLENVGIGLIATPGRTPIEALADDHVDVTNLTYKSLGNLANCVVGSFGQERVKRYTVGALKKLLKQAIYSGQLSKEAIAPSVASKL